MSLERFETFDLRELRLGESAVGADDESRLHMIAAVGREVPHLLDGIPLSRGNSGLKGCQLVQVVLSRDRLAVRENLGTLGVVVLRHVVHLVEQRQVVIRDDVACHTGVSIPVPGAADIRAALDDPNALDAVLAQSRGGQQRRESSADKQNFDGIVDWFARRDFAGVRIDFVSRQLARQVGRVLRGAFGTVAQP